MFEDVSLEFGQATARELRDALSMTIRELQDMVLRAPKELNRRERARFQSYCESLAERLEIIAEAIDDQLQELPEETDEQREARWPQC